MLQAGFSAHEIVAADREAKTIRKQRMVTLNELRAKLQSLMVSNPEKYGKIKPSQYGLPAQARSPPPNSGCTSSYIPASPIMPSRRRMRETNPLYVHSPHPRKRALDYAIQTPKRQKSPKYESSRGVRSPFRMCPGHNVPGPLAPPQRFASPPPPKLYYMQSPSPPQYLYSYSPSRAR